MGYDQDHHFRPLPLLPVLLHPLACYTPLPGLAELEAAAKALQLRHFKAGDLIYDEGDAGNDCWVTESGVYPYPSTLSLPQPQPQP